EAERGIERIYETIDRLSRTNTGKESEPDRQLLDDFRREMDDDFNTPKALALIFDEVRSLNRLLDGKRASETHERGLALKEMCAVLGLLEDSPEVFFERKKTRWLEEQGRTHEQIEQRLAARNQARKEKNWQEADRIRQELQDQGISIEDTPDRTVWKVK